MKALTPQDLSLFLNQEVQVITEPEGKYHLFAVDFAGGCSITHEDGETKILGLDEVKPICRRIEDMTGSEKIALLEWSKLEVPTTEPISTNQTWKTIKWLTSKGICPFDEWFDQGLVIEKVKELV